MRPATSSAAGVGLSCAFLLVAFVCAQASEQSSSRAANLSANSKSPFEPPSRAGELKRLGSGAKKAELAAAIASDSTGSKKKDTTKAQKGKKFQTRMMRSAEHSTGGQAAQSQLLQHDDGQTRPDLWSQNERLVPTFTDQEQGDEMVALASEVGAAPLALVEAPAEARQLQQQQSADLSQAKLAPQMSRVARRPNVGRQTSGDQTADANSQEAPLYSGKFAPVRISEPQSSAAAAAAPVEPSQPVKEQQQLRQPQPQHQRAPTADDYYSDEDEDEDELQQQRSKPAGNSDSPQQTPAGNSAREDSGAQLGADSSDAPPSPLAAGGPTDSRPVQSQTTGGGWTPTESRGAEPSRQVAPRASDKLAGLIGGAGRADALSALAKTDMAIEYLRGILKTKQQRVSPNNGANQRTSDPAFYPLPGTEFERSIRPNDSFVPIKPNPTRVQEEQQQEEQAKVLPQQQQPSSAGPSFLSEARFSAVDAKLPSFELQFGQQQLAAQTRSSVAPPPPQTSSVEPARSTVEQAASPAPTTTGAASTTSATFVPNSRPVQATQAQEARQVLPGDQVAANSMQSRFEQPSAGPQMQQQQQRQAFAHELAMGSDYGDSLDEVPRASEQLAVQSRPNEQLAEPRPEEHEQQRPATFFVPPAQVKQSPAGQLVAQAEPHFSVGQAARAAPAQPIVVGPAQFVERPAGQQHESGQHFQAAQANQLHHNHHLQQPQQQQLFQSPQAQPESGAELPAPTTQLGSAQLHQVELAKHLVGLQQISRQFGELSARAQEAHLAQVAHKHHQPTFEPANGNQTRSLHSYPEPAQSEPAGLQPEAQPPPFEQVQQQQQQQPLIHYNHRALSQHNSAPIRHSNPANQFRAQEPANLAFKEFESQQQQLQVRQRPPKIVSYNYFESAAEQQAAREPNANERPPSNSSGQHEPVATNFQLGDSLLSSNGDVEQLLSGPELEAIQSQFLSAEHPTVPIEGRVTAEQRVRAADSLQRLSSQQESEELLKQLASNSDEQSASVVEAPPSLQQQQQDNPQAARHFQQAAEPKRKSLIVYLNHPREAELKSAASAGDESLARLLRDQTTGDPFVAAREFDARGLSSDTRQLEVSGPEALPAGAAQDKRAQDKEGLSVVVIGDAYKYKKIVLLISAKSGGLKFIPMVKDMK